MRIPTGLDLAIWGVAAAGVVILLLVVNDWRVKATVDLPAAEQARDRWEDHASAVERKAAENATNTETHGNEFEQAKRDQDAARADTPVRVVRVCEHRLPAAAPARDAAGGDHAAGSEGLPEAAGSSARVSRDIGPDLYGIADEADRCAIQRDALIEWIRDNP